MKASNHEMFIKLRQKELFNEIKKLNIFKRMEEQYREPELPADIEISTTPVDAEKEIMPKPVEPDPVEPVVKASEKTSNKKSKSTNKTKKASVKKKVENATE